MGYKDTTLTEKFPTLGDDVWVTIKNPDLLPDVELEQRDAIKNPDGSENEDDRLLAYYELLASLVVDASLFGKDGKPLPLPLTADDMHTVVPRKVRIFITKALKESADPQ